MSFRINLDTPPEHPFCSDGFFRSAFSYTEGPGSAGAKYCVPLRPGRMAATVRCAVRPLEGAPSPARVGSTFRQALALGGHVRMGEKARPSSMPTLLRSGWPRPPVRVWQATGADTVPARE